MSEEANKTRQHVQRLRDMDACPEAVRWAATQPSLKQAWRVCKRGDWMLWWAGEVGVDRKRLVWVACQCARLALEHVPDGEERPRRAIEVAEAWARGRDGVTLEDVKHATAAANAAYIAADAAAYAAYAADAAAANAAAAATHAAYAAATAANHAAYAAAYAAYAAAQDRVLAECATICRREWPTLPEETERLTRKGPPRIK